MKWSHKENYRKKKKNEGEIGRWHGYGYIYMSLQHSPNMLFASSRFNHMFYTCQTSSVCSEGERGSRVPC